MRQVYPALTQSKPEYKEENTIQVSNYKNYVYQCQSSKYWNELMFDGFALPGQGEYKPYCMKWVSWGCNNTAQHPFKKHYAEHEIKTCKTSNCPKCFESWINRQASRSTRRFSKFAEDKQYNFRHIILSPPQEKAKTLTYNELKKWLSNSLKVANIKTAAVVFHPFRFQDHKKSKPYISPHFHLLVYGKVTNTTEFYNKTNWLIKNKGDMKTDVDIFNCVRYLLSHAGVRSKTHVIRYLGDISYRKLKVEKEVIEHGCPHCNLPLRIFQIVKSPKADPPPLDLIGLYEPDCFTPIDPYDPEIKIPFYQLKEDNTTEYEEELLYSFEEILSTQTNSKVIADHIYKMSQLKFKTSIDCEKLERYTTSENPYNNSQNQNSQEFWKFSELHTKDSERERVSV